MFKNMFKNTYITELLFLKLLTPPLAIKPLVFLILVSLPSLVLLILLLLMFLLLSVFLLLLL